MKTLDEFFGSDPFCWEWESNLSEVSTMTKIKMIGTGFFAVALAFAAGSQAFAQDIKTSGKKDVAPQEREWKKDEKPFFDADRLVNDGIIDKATADKISDYAEKKRAEAKGPGKDVPRPERKAPEFKKGEKPEPKDMKGGKPDFAPKAPEGKGKKGFSPKCPAPKGKGFTPKAPEAKGKKGFTPKAPESKGKKGFEPKAPESKGKKGFEPKDSKSAGKPKMGGKGGFHRGGFLNELVEEGIITEKQAEAIRNAAR